MGRPFSHTKPTHHDVTVLNYGHVHSVQQTGVYVLYKCSNRSTHPHTRAYTQMHAQELNKLRLVSLTFHIPELLELLCIILSKEMSSPHTNQSTKIMLQQCVTFLSNNKSPAERLVVNTSKT